MSFRDAFVLGLATTALGAGCATEQVVVQPTAVVAEAPPKPPPEITAEEHFNNGLKASQAKDYATAKAELVKAIEKKPDLGPAHYQLG